MRTLAQKLRNSPHKITVVVWLLVAAQSYKAVNRRGLWHSCTAVHALAPRIIAAAASAIRYGRRKPLTIEDFASVADATA